MLLLGKLIVCVKKKYEKGGNVVNYWGFGKYVIWVLGLVLYKFVYEFFEWCFF